MLLKKLGGYFSNLNFVQPHSQINKPVSNNNQIKVPAVPNIKDEYIYDSPSPIQELLLKKSANSNRSDLKKNEPTKQTVLKDVVGDLDGVQAANKVISLRQMQANNEKIETNDLFSFSKVTTNNKLDFLIDREAIRDGFFAEIRSAKESIHMAMVIMNGKRVGQYMTDLLIQKKQENPTMPIRIILDVVTSYAILPFTSAFWQVRKLKKAGIEVKLNYIWRTGIEHRKLLVVDSKRAICGPSYLSDGSFGNKKYWKEVKRISKTNPDIYKQIFLSEIKGGKKPFEISKNMELPSPHDFSFRFQGDSVHDLQASFLQTWLYHGKKLDTELSDAEVVKKYFPKTEKVSFIDQIPLKLTHSTPKGVSEMRQNLLAVINFAQKTLDIEISYITMPEFMQELIKAAKRGVKIRLLVNGKNIDFRLVWYYFKNYYPQLVQEKNIELREFDSFTHCKLIIADSRVVFASTGNPEYLSWERGFDEIMLIDSPKIAQQVQTRLLDKDMHHDRSTIIDEYSLEITPWWHRVFAKILKPVFNFVFRSREPKQSPRQIIKKLK
ncbi:hypothetical protein BVY03_02785 [bacterium K02(2017)]|nr:hypothetical protein BVY03_02785 [bacterium K02(2017)]